MRSCYESEVRFYRDDPRTVRIRWYFVPMDTPAHPNPGEFISADNDSDPKGDGELGEQWSAGRTWADGTGPPWARRGPPCGTAAEWREGLAAPPVPEPGMDRWGRSLCCPGAEPAPPVLWLVGADAPSPMTHGTIWPGRNGWGAAVAVAGPFTGPVRVTEGGVTFVRLQQGFSTQPPPGNWQRGFFSIGLPPGVHNYSLYFVARPRLSGPVCGVLSANAWPVRSAAGAYRWRQGGQELTVIAPAVAGWQLWEVHRGGGRLVLRHMGVVDRDIPDPVPNVGLQLHGLDMNAGGTENASAEVAELLVYPFVQSPGERAFNIDYLARRYGMELQ